VGSFVIQLSTCCAKKQQWSRHFTNERLLTSILMTQRPGRASMVVLSMVAFTVALAAAIYGWFYY
jgi:hypothetical protein